MITIVLREISYTNEGTNVSNSAKQTQKFATHKKQVYISDRERGKRGRPVFELRDNSQSARATLAWFTSSAASQLNLWDVVMDRSRRLPSAGAGCWRRDVRSERRRKALIHSPTQSQTVFHRCNHLKTCVSDLKQMAMKCFSYRSRMFEEKAVILIFHYRLIFYAILFQFLWKLPLSYIELKFESKRNTGAINNRIFVYLILFRF